MPRSAVVLLLSLALGLLAVAHASRGLLDDEHEHEKKCHPTGHQDPCPKGKVKDCFHTEPVAKPHPYHPYAKVSKQHCFNDEHVKNSYVISYTNKKGHPACTDGYTKFYAKCHTYVKLYIVDAKYYNKNGKKYYVPEECKDECKDYEPCSVCKYKSFKVECEEDKEHKPKDPKGHKHDDEDEDEEEKDD